MTVTPESLRLEDPSLRTRMDWLLEAPAELLLPERLFLYALVRALRPARSLEIGCHFGGSTAIICAALDDIGQGTLTSVDPAPTLAPELHAALAHRTQVVAGRSPDALASAVLVARGPFDFAFIDGDHSRAGVCADILGIVPVAATGAHLLLHDAHSPKITAGIDDALRACPALVDAGVVSTLTTTPYVAPDGTTPLWGGLRLLRLAPAPAEDLLR